MPEFFFIGALCAFFTMLVIWRPNFMWSILAAISWMLLLWYSRSNPFPGVTIGDFGDLVFISVCIGAAAFVLLYTIRDSKVKKEEEIKKAKENGEYQAETGIRESPDDYYDRLNRLTKRTK